MFLEYYIQLFRNKLFVLGLITKIIFIFLFSSQVINNLFVPFIDYFTGSLNNPYEYFLNINRLEVFPYPAFMLYTLSVFKYVFIFLPTAVAIKFTLLVADFVILVVLDKFLPKYRNEVIILYWLSPVLIYISYVHGQLDGIPVAILFVSFYLLSCKKFVLSLFFLGIAVATKTNMVIAVPFAVIYLFFLSSYSKKETIFYVTIIPCTFLILNIFFIESAAFYKMVFYNNVQNIIFDINFRLGNWYIYLPIFGYIILLFQAMLLKIKSRDIFILFICFAFGVIMIFIPPMPGWYYWILPFWIYFYSSSTFRGLLLFYSLQICFLVFFAVIPTSDYFAVLPSHMVAFIPYNNIYLLGITLGLNMDICMNVTLTLLQALLILNVYWIYKRGLERYAQYKIISKPMLIGIGGNSGAGKSTVAYALINLFGNNNVTSIKGDDLHKWERGDKNWTKYTHLDPKANELHDEYMYLRNFKFERNLNRRHYDHSSGKFVYSKDKLKANRVVIYDGLHPFYLQKVRELFDIKIFIKPEESLAKFWKISRDVKNRGHSVEKVIKQIEERQSDYNKYIKPQESSADIVITINPVVPIMDFTPFSEEPKTWYYIKCKNLVYLEPFVEMLRHMEGIDVDHTYGSDDWQSLSIYGSPQAIEIKRFGESLDIHKIGIDSPKWMDKNDGITQIFMLYYIFEVINEHN